MLVEQSNYSVKAAAHRLGVSVSKLYQLAASRKIGHYRIGGKIMLSQADISAFLANCHVDVAMDAPTPHRRPFLKHLDLGQ